jgi:hypothetical protein
MSDRPPGYDVITANSAGGSGTGAYGYDCILTLNQCDNVYGQAPCTATGAVGFECYQCFSTCQDKANYVPVNKFLTLNDNGPRVPVAGTPGEVGTLDPGFINPASVLSEGNLRINFGTAFASPCSARSTNSHTTGKWVFEVTNAATQSDTTNQSWAGICLAGQQINNIPGGDFEVPPGDSELGYSVQYGNHAVGTDSWIWHLSVRGNIPPHNWTDAGEHMMICVDLDAGTISFISEEVGTLTQFYSGIASNTWFACIAGGGSAADMTINLGATPFTNAIPAGYSPWNGGVGTVIPDTGYPCLTKPPKLTSAQIKRGEGLSSIGAVTITARDFVDADRPPHGLDPYWETRSPVTGGTFFPRLKARYPYLQRSAVFIAYYTFDAAGAKVIHSFRRYAFDTMQGPDAAGTVIIKARDVLAALSGEDSVTPLVDNSELTSNINSTATSIPISNAFSPPWPVTNGEFTVGDEAIFYAAFDGVTATGCIRGLNDTTPVKHDAGDRTQVVTLYANMNVVDVIYDLLVTHAGIDPARIPYNNNPLDPDEWDIEKEKYLSGHTINHGIPQPKKVYVLLKGLLSQCYLHMWYEPTTALVRLAATNTRVAELEATPVTEERDILAGTLKIKEVREGMVTQAWTYFDKYSYTLSDEPQNFGSVFVTVNTELEDPNAWGQKTIRPLLADWLRGGGNIAITTNNRTLNENNAPRYEVTFQVDGSSTLLLGEFITLSLFQVQDPAGVPITVSCQIVKHTELIPTARIEITATILRIIDLDAAPLRFGNIVNTFNETVEYSDATQLAKDSWAWVSTPGGFANGDAPYVIL